MPTDLRAIPDSALSPTATCQGCRQAIIWTTTLAGPNGRGGKALPIDPVEDLAGNVAVRPAQAGRLVSRVLAKDETVDRPLEYCAMPHFASCPVGAHPTPPERPEPAPSRRRRGGRR